MADQVLIQENVRLTAENRRLKRENLYLRGLVEADAKLLGIYRSLVNRADQIFGGNDEVS